MGIENPFQNTPSADASSSKEVFMKALDKELLEMQQLGRISPGQVEEKRKAAALIESGFSDDPEHDAKLFSVAGIAGERELSEILEKKGTKN